MIKKRNKFWTVVFSMIPGAGHMFNGFMKTGVSLMIAFFAGCFINVWIQIPILMLPLPIIWFYAFFDCINKTFISDEEFYTLKDTYIFSLDTVVNEHKNKVTGATKFWIGIALLLVGLYILWDNVFMYYIRNYYEYSDQVYQILSSLSYLIPQVVCGLIIIIIGIRLIKGKKKTLLPAEGDAD